MEALALSFRVITPVFALIGLGIVLKKIKLLEGESINKLIGLAFKVFFFVLIFNNLYNTTIEEALDLPVIFFAAGYVICVFILCMIFIPIIEKSNPKRGALIQGIFRSNNLIFGVPIITALCGDEKAGSMTMVIAIVVTLYNALGVVALEVFSGKKIDLKLVLLNIIKNPFVAASILGIIALVAGLKLPYVIEKPIADISGIAVPLSLILLGGYIDFSSVKGAVKNIAIGVVGRLIIIPAIFIGAAILIGFRGPDLIILVATISAPPPIASFIMAKQMKADADLAAHLVVFSTLFSAGTLFLIIYLLKQFTFI